MIKRPALKRNNLNDGNYNNNKMIYNFCYDNHFEDINISSMNSQMNYGRENEPIYPRNYNSRMIMGDFIKEINMKMNQFI